MSNTAIIVMCITLVFVVFTVAEIMLVMKLFKCSDDKVEKLDKKINRVDELDKKIDQIDKHSLNSTNNLISQQEKMLTLIQKFKQGVYDMHSARQRDIDQLFKAFGVITENVKQGMKCHNELVDDMYESFEEVFCDLYDGDCSQCYWRSRCIEKNECDSGECNSCESTETNEPKEPNPFRENASVVNCSALVLGPDGKKHELDLSKPESIEEIKKSLKSTGLPDAAINEIVGKMISDVKKMLKKDTRAEKKPVTDPIKLIDPNSKIVKTLEKLYQQK